MAGALTKYGIGQQVIKILKGSNNPAQSSWRMPEVQLFVGQVVNKLISASPLNADKRTAQLQGIDVSGLCLAEYTLTVSTVYTNYSKVTLPCTPARVLHKGKDIGVYWITKANDPFGVDCLFVQIPAEGIALVQGEPVISELLTQYGFRRKGRELLFTANLPALTVPITSLTVTLIVFDVGILTDHDPLPCPADWEADIIQGVLALMGLQAPADNKVDAASETKQTIKQ